MRPSPRAAAGHPARPAAALLLLLATLAGLLSATARAGPSPLPPSPLAVDGAASLPIEWGQPLEPYRGLAATFGEFRPTHLHAGVDLSTGGRNGLAVRAVADGEIYRARDTHRGFGRALFVRHAGGYVSLYAHLSAFTGKEGLESMVLARAGGFGRHAGDISLEKPIPVKKGEVIAFSGESGEGLPHLHLEIRDGDNRPVNPRSVGLPFADREAPVMEELILETDPDSAAGGGGMAVRVPLGASDAPAVPALRGKVRMRLRAFDRAVADSRLGLYEVEVKLDGEPFFAERFDRITYDDWHRVGTVMDPLESHLSPTVYEYNLFRHPGNTFGLVTFASSLAEGGLDTGRLAAGGHRLEITARDAAGNSASTQVRFTVAPHAASDKPLAPAAAGLPVAAQRGGKAAWDDIELAFPAGALYEDALVRREKSPAPDDPDLPRVSAAWLVSCTSYPFELPATLALRADNRVKDARRVGLYTWDRFRSRWICLGSEPGTAPGWVAAKVRNPGTFALFEDTRPPVIGEASRAGNLVLVPLEDRGTGIDEARLTISLDGKPLPLEHDPDRGRVEAELPAGLARGDHRLALEAFDRAGNRARREQGLAVP